MPQAIGIDFNTILTIFNTQTQVIHGIWYPAACKINATKFSCF